MKNLEKTIEQYNTKINDIPVDIFTQLNSSRESGIICYKYDTPLHGEEIKVKKGQTYSLFDMYSLSSLSIIFAYVFVFENKSFEVRDKYLTIKRPSVKHLDSLSGVELEYRSNYINVYVSQEGAALISANKLFAVVEQDMVRRSKGSNR